MSKKLLIVDDHEIIRLGLHSMLEMTDLEIVGQAASAAEALAAIETATPDVVLMDIRMEGGDGLNALGRMKLDHPDLPIVLFSAYDNPTYIARAVALGASGYVLKISFSRKAGRSSADRGGWWVSLDEGRVATGDRCFGDAKAQSGH